MSPRLVRTGSIPAPAPSDLARRSRAGARVEQVQPGHAVGEHLGQQTRKLGQRRDGTGPSSPAKIGAPWARAMCDSAEAAFWVSV